jgi:hypothetical protein
MTILKENHRSFLIVEHDPLLYEDDGEMVEYLAQALWQMKKNNSLSLYMVPSPWITRPPP